MQPDPFEKHGIKHISASSLNLYKAQPSLWCGKYLLGWKDEVGPAAWRGSAVEAGLDLALYDRSAPFEAVAEKAFERFDLDAQGEITDKIDKERAAIPDFIKQAFEGASEWGIPNARQFKLEAWIDGITVPLKGYADYVFDDFIVDLKTTFRMPSEPQGNHSAQVAAYWKATGKVPRLLYATPKKWAVYELTPEQCDAAWDDLRRAAFALRSMLAKADDGADALGMFAPDFDSFYWADSTKAACVEAFMKDIAA